MPVRVSGSSMVSRSPRRCDKSLGEHDVLLQNSVADARGGFRNERHHMTKMCERQAAR
jgi:hypothetical protein